MSINNRKLIELISVEKEADNHFIVGNLFLDEKIDFTWEIDYQTAYHLDQIVSKSSRHKYRLSLKHTDYNTQTLPTASLTKTLRDSSEKVDFACSDEFLTNIEILKTTTDKNGLMSLPFIHTNQSKEEPKDDNVPESKKSNKPLFQPNKLFYTLLTMSILVLLLGYSSGSSNNESAYAEAIKVANDSPEKSLFEAGIKKENMRTLEESISKDQPQLNKNTESSTPTFSVNETVNFYVPEGSVAITFDDGPSKYTKEIVDILKSNQVGGTFFFIGQNVKQNPNMVNYAFKNGFSVGNHSLHHPDLTKLTYEQQAMEILQTNKLIEDVTHHPVSLFRPPYEAKNDTTVDLMKNMNMKMILWNRDPKDWKNRDPKKIMSYVVNHNSSGSIILLHESQAVIDLLPQLIDYLQNQNLKIVNLSTDNM